MSQYSIPTVIDPSLLKAANLRAPLKVFVCGPGDAHPLYGARIFIKNYLRSQEAVTVTFGEDLVGRKLGKKGDLQTVESLEAERSDFIVLLVDSPGSVAELGCFSSNEFLRHRLFAVIPRQYFGATSYIARGPLSALASKFQNSVIYFDPKNQSDLQRAVMVPTAMFKYIAGGYQRYRPYLDKGSYTKDPKAHLERFLRDRNEFVDAFVLAAILAELKPTFSQLLSSLRFSPRELKESLHRLFKAESIRKQRDTYLSVHGFSDPVLCRLNSGSVSVRKAAIFSMLH